LAQALAKVAAGETYFEADIARVIFQRLANHGGSATLRSFDSAEREVLVSIAQGLSNVDMRRG